MTSMTNGARAYGAVSRTLHWVTVLALLAQFTIGYLLGATVGVGTVAVVLALGPLVDLSSRLMRLDVHQT
jgi:uncharacterized membrane protein YczE